MTQTGKVKRIRQEDGKYIAEVEIIDEKPKMGFGTMAMAFFVTAGILFWPALIIWPLFIGVIASIFLGLICLFLWLLKPIFGTMKWFVKLSGVVMEGGSKMLNKLRRGK